MIKWRCYSITIFPARCRQAALAPKWLVQVVIAVAGFTAYAMRGLFMLQWISFGIRPWSNLWHACWMTLTFSALLTIWILDMVYDLTPPYPGPYVNTSYIEDFIELVPIGTILIGFLAAVGWIAWWREQQKARKPVESIAQIAARLPHVPKYWEREP